MSNYPVTAVAAPVEHAEIVPHVIDAFDAADAVLDAVLAHVGAMEPRARVEVRQLVRRYQARREFLARGW